jgi:hypothetical protein
MFCARQAKEHEIASTDDFDNGAGRRPSGSGARSKATTRAPLFFTRLRQIGSPITPRPIKPTDLYRVIFCSRKLFHETA